MLYAQAFIAVFAHIGHGTGYLSALGRVGVEGAQIRTERPGGKVIVYLTQDERSYEAGFLLVVDYAGEAQEGIEIGRASCRERV